MESSLFEWYGVAIERWLAAGIAFALLSVSLFILRVLLRRILAHYTAARWAVLAGLVQRTRLFFLLAVAAFTVLSSLGLPETQYAYISEAFLVATMLQAGFWAVELLDYLLRTRGGMAQAPAASLAVEQTTMSGVLGVLGRVLVWGLIILLILENVTGLKATSLIASLGITGIAVALALQRVLGELFAALSIALDKPFVVGDTVSVSEFSGVVEQIGLRSTRLRSVDGETVVFSNTDLLNSRLRNFTDLKRRRVHFNLYVAYDTPQQKLKAIPDLLRESITSQPEVMFSQAYFKSFGEAALIFEVAYFVESPDNAVYIERQQAINQAIIEHFEHAGIAFATPALKNIHLHEGSVSHELA